jgi:hypothetical protein
MGILTVSPRLGNNVVCTNGHSRIRGLSIWPKSVAIAAVSSLINFWNVSKSKQVHSISTRAFIVNTVPQNMTVILLGAERERTHSVNHM